MGNDPTFSHRSRKTPVKFNGNTRAHNLAEALDLISLLEKHRTELQHEDWLLKDQYSKDSEKLAFYEEVAATDHLFDFDEAAGIFGTGRTRLFSYLRKHRVLKRSSHNLNRPYQKYLDAGHFEAKHLQYVNRNTGVASLKTMPFFTGKGLIWLQKFIAKHGRAGL